MKTYLWIVVCVYFIITIVIGFMANRTLKGKDDSSGYFLGGKSFGPIFSAFKFATTFESGSSMISTTGLTYQAGMVGFQQQYCLPFAYFLTMRLYGPRVKVACDHFDTITVPQLLSKRYNSKAIRVAAAVVVVISMGGTLLAQFKAMAGTFSVVMQIPYVWALLISVFIVGIYSVVGGYTASVWTDFVQGLLMLAGMFLLCLYSQLAFFGRILPFWKLFPALYAYIGEVNPQMLTITGGALSVTLIIVYLLINFASGLALPQQAVVLFSVKSVKVLKWTLAILVCFSVLLLWSGGSSSLMAVKLLQGHTFMDADLVIPTLTLEVMPGWAAGIFIAAILSAIMSTVDGVVLIAASSISQDILDIVMHEKYQKRSVMYDRIAVFGVTIICVLLAVNPPTIVFFIVAFSFIMQLYSFLMPMIGVCYSKKANAWGAMATVVAGGVVLPFWMTIGQPFIDAYTLGLIMTPVVFFVFNKIGSGKCDETAITKPLFEKFAQYAKW